jgi:hypothetical protein
VTMRTISRGRFPGPSPAPPPARRWRPCDRPRAAWPGSGGRRGTGRRTSGPGPPLAPGGEGDAEDLGGTDRVLEEQLVEVTEAEEEEGVPGAGLRVEVLADHGRDRHVRRLLVRRHRPCCGRASIPPPPPHLARVCPTTPGGFRW